MKNINLKKDVRPEMDGIKVVGTPINLSDFWFYVEGVKDDGGDPFVFHVTEGTGDNLLPEDVDDGFNDYVYYEVYGGKVTYSLIDDYEQGGNTLEKMEMAGGQVMLYNPYKELGLKQVCWKVLDFFGVEDPEECTVRILSGKFADPSFPTGGAPTAAEKDQPLAARDLVIAAWAKNGGDFTKTLRFIQRKEHLGKQEALAYSEMVHQTADKLGGKLITIIDPDYPETCKRRDNPPFCVIVKDDTIYTEIKFSLKKPLKKSSK